VEKSDIVEKKAFMSERYFQKVPLPQQRQLLFNPVVCMSFPGAKRINEIYVTVQIFLSCFFARRVVSNVNRLGFTAYGYSFL
jgi:hypothetical protein